MALGGWQIINVITNNGQTVGIYTRELDSRYKLNVGGGISAVSLDLLDDIKMGYEHVSRSESNTYSVIATCPQGKMVTGGGYTSNSGELLFSTPTGAGTQWQCSYSALGNINTTAICANIR